MLIHPWDAALDAASGSLAGRHGQVRDAVVNNLDPAEAPLALPTQFALAGQEILLHLARPSPIWRYLEAAAEVRLAVIGYYAYIPTQ